MFNVKIGNRTYIATDGERLSDVFIKNGIYFSHPCGGRGVCEKCKVLVDGKEMLSCRYTVHSDIVVSFCEIEGVTPRSDGKVADGMSGNLVFALDIGTTALELALVSCDTSTIIKKVSSRNPQSVFGADVISRIDYCRKHSTEPLKNILVAEINALVESFGLKTAPDMYVSGNTVMLHILFGADPSPMGVAPYKPRFTVSFTESGIKIGIKKIGNVISLPCISAFAGADLVAGMNFVGMPPKGKYNLLVDLGTNAETVIFSRNSALCTSAAAGPCFEGVNIVCGMTASDGAVYTFNIGENGEPYFETVGNVPPAGICATGLIDIISELHEHRIIDETGYMECEKYRITDSVYLSQADIRQYQLAKSAVYSAIITLIKKAGADFKDIHRLYISGGFSTKLNVNSAFKTGLLPKELKEKVLAVNNSSLEGTVKFACEKNNLCEYLKNAEYIDLSTDEMFSGLFMNNMEF